MGQAVSPGKMPFPREGEAAAPFFPDFTERQPKSPSASSSSLGSWVNRAEACPPGSGGEWPQGAGGDAASPAEVLCRVLLFGQTCTLDDF